MESNYKVQQFSDLAYLIQKVNDALLAVPDKEWNYSRITLQLRPLEQVGSPYSLWLEQVDISQKTGRAELACLKSEIAWGCRHSEELGILEIMSLRLNRALLEHTTDEFWGNQRLVVRIAKKQALESQGIAEAFWYQVQEVGGDDFDNR
jgi:hypothetical protein